MVMVCKAGKQDLEILANLAILMWNSHSLSELIAEFSEIIKNGESQFFLKYENDLPVGFAQCQLRHDYVEGTSTTPVGYLEGIFVKEGYRNKGYAKELLEECEAWAKYNGCKEFASDCEIDNIDSCHFHKAMNFTEANRIICFTKAL
jgi:aminoglycoside 6'-N-acetyltransferase I